MTANDPKPPAFPYQKPDTATAYVASSPSRPQPEPDPPTPEDRYDKAFANVDDYVVAICFGALYDMIAALEAAGYRIVRESAVLTEAERDRIAEAAHNGVEAYLAERIDGYVPKPFAAAFHADRDVRFAQADAILALPELRALAAEELFVMCGECHGVRTVPDTVQPHWGRRPCPRCAGVGYVSIGGKQP